MEKVHPQAEQWLGGMAKNITFIVTKDCQLACKYCYLVGKNASERMPWEVAKQAIDYILDQEAEMREQGVIWDFIGGEPFLEIDLIDRICDYLKVEMFRRGHHWFNSYRFSFSTNGINYHTDKVQQFIRKNRDHLSIGITIDGTAKKHDLNRIYKGDGRGSYADVVRNIPLWLEQFPNGGTKVTISSADIPYIKESVLHLYSLGIHEVNIRCHHRGRVLPGLCVLVLLGTPGQAAGLRPAKPELVRGRAYAGRGRGRQLLPLHTLCTILPA